MGIFSNLKRRISFPNNGDTSTTGSTYTMVEQKLMPVPSERPSCHSKVTEEVHENTFVNVRSRDKGSTSNRSENVSNQWCSFACCTPLSVPCGQPITNIAGVDGHIIQPSSLSFLDLAKTVRAISTRKDFVEKSFDHLELQISNDTPCAPTSVVALISFLSSVFSLSATDVALILNERSCEMHGSNSFSCDNPTKKHDSEKELSVKAVTNITQRPLLPQPTLSAFGTTTAKSVYGTKRGKRSESTSDQQLSLQKEVEEKENTATRIFSEDAKSGDTCTPVEAAAEKTLLLLLQKKKGNKMSAVSAKQFEGNILWPLSTEETPKNASFFRRLTVDSFLDAEHTFTSSRETSNIDETPLSDSDYETPSSIFFPTSTFDEVKNGGLTMDMDTYNGSKAIKYMLYTNANVSSSNSNGSSKSASSSSTNSSVGSNVGSLKLASKNSKMPSSSSSSSLSPASSLSILSMSLLRARASQSSVYVPPLVLNSQRIRAFFRALLTLTSVARTNTNQEQQQYESVPNSTESYLKGKERGDGSLAPLSNIWGALVTLRRIRRSRSSTTHMIKLGASSRKSDSSTVGKKRQRSSGPIEDSSLAICGGEQSLLLPVPPPSPCSPSSSFLTEKTHRTTLDPMIPPRMPSELDPNCSSQLKQNSVSESENKNSTNTEHEKYSRTNEKETISLRMLRDWASSPLEFTALASNDDTAVALIEDLVDSGAVDDDHDDALSTSFAHRGSAQDGCEANDRYMYGGGVAATDPRVSSSSNSAVPKQFVDDYDACLGDPFACRPWGGSVKSDFSSSSGRAVIVEPKAMCCDDSVVRRNNKHFTKRVTNNNNNLRPSDTLRSEETGWASQQHDDRLLIDHSCQCLSKRFNSHCPCVECCLRSTFDALSSTLALQHSSSALHSEKEKEVLTASLLVNQFKSFSMGCDGTIHSDENIVHQSCCNEVLTNDSLSYSPSTNPTPQARSKSDHLKSTCKSDTSKGRSKRGRKSKRAAAPPTRSAPPMDGEAHVAEHKTTRASRSIAKGIFDDEAILEYIRDVVFGNNFSSRSTTEQLHAANKALIFEEHLAAPSHTSASNDESEGSGQSGTRRAAYHTEVCTDDTRMYVREDFRKEILEAAAVLLCSELLID